MKKFILIFSIMLLSLGAWAKGEIKEYSVDEVPNVHLQNREWFVSDPDSMLSSSARDAANQRLRALMDTTGVEVVIVVLPGIKGEDIFTFSQSLAQKWGVGKKDKNNGLVVLFDMGARQVRIHTGKGMEGVLPDAACNRIIDEVIIPRMRTGDLDDAVADVSQKIYEVFTDPAAAAEVSSTSPNDAADFREFTHIILLLALLVGLGLYVAIILKLIKLRHRNDFEKTRLISSSMPTYWIFAALSLGIGLPGALLMWWLSKYYRNKPHKCEVCGTTMKKLSEDEDNNYLTPAQDLEEKINSVDYDVWLCPKCGTTDIFPFVQQSPYQQCPNCHTRAYSMIYDRVERQPTSTFEGRGVKVYSCKNCGFRHNVPYTIARVAPVIIAGGIGGRGGGGGGFSGGSFGGGSFGGGGASGSW